MTVPLPMFPLGTVLFPHEVLPLHVFEPRYQALVQDCLDTGHEFGVVLIERGSEVGGGDTRFGVGTVARLAEAARLPGDRWMLLAVGGRRIRVTTWLPDDPYPLALVEPRADTPLPVAVTVALDDAARAVRRALSLKVELREAAPPLRMDLHHDPDVALWQLAAAAPLTPVDKQRLLETDDAGERLRLLTTLATDAGDVLAYRLSAG